LSPSELLDEELSQFDSTMCNQKPDDSKRSMNAWN
jgi:hypothetical protein